MAKLNKQKHKVVEHIDILKYLQKISPHRQKVIIKAADRPILEAFSEIALNMIKKMFNFLQLRLLNYDLMRSKYINYL